MRIESMDQGRLLKYAQDLAPKPGQGQGVSRPVFKRVMREVRRRGLVVVLEENQKEQKEEEQTDRDASYIFGKWSEVVPHICESKGLYVVIDTYLDQPGNLDHDFEGVESKKSIEDQFTDDAYRKILITQELIDALHRLREE